ncbi:HEAT repeat domain-containing protein [Rossellomorea vietnamensis]|uniref:HEAT repeat domain-containing protein n=1 Tax=Rossellomorea vietnamensis TaxID=218284 RepID=A0A5D4NM23_9BACI|nr:HEAT repeat domain-containing protein [Rossellomorea vietnamensis]TYS14959.1 HEAT repeat domain-containing protein [Rossellomorea vietnamensis]
MVNVSYLQIAIAIAGALCLLLVMLGYLLIRKKLEQRKMADLRMMIERIRPLLIQELLRGEEEELNQIKKDAVFKGAIEETLKNLGANLDSSSFKRTIGDTAGKYLSDSLNKDLSSRRWADRMNALVSIKDFQIYSFVPDLWKLYEKSGTSQEEKNLILQIAAGADDQKLLDVLAVSSPYQSTFFYKQIIRRVSPETLNLIIASFNDISSSFKVAILSYIGEKRDLSLLPFTESCLDSEDHEVRVNAVKAIRSIGFISKPQALYPYSQSESWVEQMSFAQAAGEIAHPGYKDMLFELLSSSNWWVRYYAGEALSKFKDGKLLLKDAAENHQDAFARDMASQWLGSV